MSTIVCGWSLDLNMGGTESYMMRMAKWAKHNGHKFVIALQKGRTIDPIWNHDIQKNNITIESFSVRKPYKVIQISSEFKHLLMKEDVYIIATDITSYFQFVFFKVFSKANKISIIYYILHPYVCKITSRRLVNYPYYIFMKKQIGKSIIFMDEESVNYCKKFYNKNFDVNEVYRIGFEIEPLSTKIITDRIKNRDQLVVLSCSRMDFPFKGYQMGLINEIERIIERYTNIHFIIIGTGKDASMLDDVIKSKPISIRSHITRIDKVPYNQLDEYMKKSHVYIGMGTTLLDAAKFGLPSIVATMNQMGIQSSGFFSDNYNNVTGNLEMSNKTTNFIELIDCISKMDNNSYRELQLETYEVYKEHYNINSVMQRILAFKSSDMNVSRLLMVYEFFLAKHQKRII